MYKCGWNGCEKAYGTLNHLNAHVTMQSHGAKRTPEGMLFFFFCFVDFLSVSQDVGMLQYELSCRNASIRLARVGGR